MEINRKERLIQNLASSVLLDNTLEILSTQKTIKEDIDAIKSEKTKEKQERE